MPAVSIAAALSFLKETKGALTWTAQEFARGVGITVAEAGPALGGAADAGLREAGRRQK